jgi:hypothetical protein
MSLPTLLQKRFAWRPMSTLYGCLVSVNTGPLLLCDDVTVITSEDIFGLQSSDPQQEGGCFHEFIDFRKLKLTFMAYSHPNRNI